eukprot:3757915-Ditylum_brightwellii.AAC.1
MEESQWKRKNSKKDGCGDKNDKGHKRAKHNHGERSGKGGNIIYGHSSIMSQTMRIVLSMARAIMQEAATTTLIRRKGEAINSKEGATEVIGIQVADKTYAETMSQAQHEK